MKVNKNKAIRVKVRNWILYWVAVGIGVFVLVFLITSTWIGVSVKGKCDIAISKYEGGCVEALIMQVDDNNAGYVERNNAIWALGQMGDKRGKLVLEKYYTGYIPNREPYAEGLSQYEMRKALKLMDGGINITHIVWGWWR